MSSISPLIANSKNLRRPSPYWYMSNLRRLVAYLLFSKTKYWHKSFCITTCMAHTLIQWRGKVISGVFAKATRPIKLSTRTFAAVKQNKVPKNDSSFTGKNYNLCRQIVVLFKDFLGYINTIRCRVTCNSHYLNPSFIWK